ncbi:MAG TPA: choice-of-anchor Q domain-containing protein [Caldilineaceae bacterium]|nr:choice-of-anchor Q domain-containing protein [Caldilineaceae bacterium]
MLRKTHTPFLSPAPLSKRSAIPPVVGAVAFACLLFGLVWIALGRPAQAQSDDPVEAAAIEDVIPVVGLNPAAVDDGNCSLIEAIDNANADAPVHDDCPPGDGADTIRLMSEAVYLFDSVHNMTDGANALPSITSEIIIEGKGATLVRNIPNNAPPFRFFHVAPGGDLTLLNLGLRHGAVGLTGTLALPAVGGAILNRGTTRVIASTISYNVATFGGAIFSDPITGSLAITGSIFSFNQADMTGGAIFNRGAGSIATTTLSRNVAGADGGALYTSSAPFTIRASTLRNNRSGGVGGALAAGAQLSHSTVLVENSQIFSNTAETAGGGVWNGASDGYTATLTLRSSAITSNSVSSQAVISTTGEGTGGGITNLAAPSAAQASAWLTLEQSLVAENWAQSGGGIANLAPSTAAPPTAALAVIRSTVANNRAQGGAGGGLFNLNGRLTIANATISGNRALGNVVEEASVGSLAGGMGGGIANTGDGLTGTLALLNSTVASNTSSSAGSGLANVGLVSGVFAIAQVGNSLFVGNGAAVSEPVTIPVTIPNTSTALIATSAVTTPTVGATCFNANGSLASLGHNLEDGDTCGFNQSGDLPNTPVALGPLANNGGPTPTHAIPFPSAAANQGDNAICSAPPVGGVDQRGVTRPQGFDCDIGAYEVAPGLLIQYMPIMKRDLSTRPPEQ